MDQKAAEQSPTPNTTEPRSVSSKELLGEASELWIQHEGEVYRLRLTRNNRLILTK